MLDGIKSSKTVRPGESFRKALLKPLFDGAVSVNARFDEQVAGRIDCGSTAATPNRGSFAVWTGVKTAACAKVPAL